MNFEEYVHYNELTLPLSSIQTNIDELLDFLQRNSNVKHLIVDKYEDVKNLAEKLKPETLSGLKKLSFRGSSLTVGKRPVSAQTVTSLAKFLVKIASLNEHLIVKLDLHKPPCETT